MRMCDGAVIDNNKHHWDAFLAGLGENDLKEVVLVLDDAEPCIPAEAVRWGILNLIEERDEARQEAKKWRDYYAAETPAERQSIEDGKWTMPWEADHA